MKVIVSLTTTSFRYDIVKYVCLSLATQSLRPDRIVLNVSREAYLFDQGLQSSSAFEWAPEIPALTINWVENTGPYRKLLPVLGSVEEDDIIVTCDDDMLYGKDWLQSLINACQANPESIVCGRGRMIRRNVFGKVQSYFNWPNAPERYCGHDILPIGAAGICYKKRMIDPEFVNGDFKHLAPTSDDMWFWGATQSRKVPVCVAKGVLENVRAIRDPLSRSLSRFNNYKANRLFGSMLYGVILQYLKKPTVYYFGISRSPNDLAFRNILNLIHG